MKAAGEEERQQGHSRTTNAREIGRSERERERARDRERERESGRKAEAKVRNLGPQQKAGRVQ